MSLRFRYVGLRVATSDGEYGTSIEFEDGLSVVRADNSMGKSTLVQAMFYGLGLEGMFGPSHEPPLPHAVKDYLKTPDGQDVPVLESHVLVEIEGPSGDRLSLRRRISGDGDRRIIETWSGGAFSGHSEPRRKKDYYVRLEGSAQRERGFHAFLEHFLGWQLPDVPRYQSPEGKLYLEAVFPLMYVEQKKGWGVVGADFPTYFRIRDVSARAIEFLLRLDAAELASRRNALSGAQRELRDEWAAYRARAAKLAELVHGVIEDLPEGPTSSWPPPVTPRVLVPNPDGEWAPLEAAIEQAEETLKRLVELEIPTAERASAEAAKRLEEAQARLATVEGSLSRSADVLEAETAHLRSVDQQVRALEEDLQRNQDLLRLRNLGSTEPWNPEPEVCPTCLQHMPRALVPLAEGEIVMSVEEQIEYIKEQGQVFRAMKEETERTLGARRRRLASQEEEASALRNEIRGLRLTLVSDPRSPSFAAVQRQVAATERLDQLKRVQASFQDELHSFEHASSRWRDLQGERRGLPEDDLSDEDRGKLARLEELLVSALGAFELKSVRPAAVTISRDSFRPMHRGFDLQFDFSASDTIRTIWAYRLSLLELARERETNHPGFLVFDEPRQHNTDASSIRAFFLRASRATDVGQQVIVATSGAEAGIKEQLEGTPHQYVSFGGQLLVPMT